MQFTQAFILSAIASGVFGLPTTSEQAATLKQLLRKPDNEQPFNWTTTASGHRMATVQVFDDHEVRDVPAPHIQSRQTAINGLGINFGSWHNLAGKVGGFAAKVKCQEGGVEYGLNKLMSGLASDACNDLASSTVPGKAANNAWTIWQSIQKDGLSPDGNPERANFGLQQNGQPPHLTQKLCNDAVAYFMSSECQGKASDTEGGIMRLFSGDSGSDNWLSFLVDPQLTSKTLGE